MGATPSLWASVSPSTAFSFPDLLLLVFPISGTGSFILPPSLGALLYVSFSHHPTTTTTHTPNAVSNLCKPTCSSHSGLGPGGVQTLLSGCFVSGLTPAVCAPLGRQRDPLKPNSGHIPPLQKPRTSPSCLESGHPFSQWSYLPHLTFTLSNLPPSRSWDSLSHSPSKFSPLLFPLPGILLPLTPHPPQLSVFLSLYSCLLASITSQKHPL